MKAFAGHITVVDKCYVECNIHICCDIFFFIIIINVAHTLCKAKSLQKRLPAKDRKAQ